MATYTFPTTKARTRFLSMVRDAGEAFSRYVFTYRGKPQAVMLGYEEYEGWMETLELVQSPTWRRALRQASREDQSGRYVALEDVVGPTPRKGRGSARKSSRGR